MFIKVEDFMIMPHTVKNLTLVAADAAVAAASTEAAAVVAASTKAAVAACCLRRQLIWPTAPSMKCHSYCLTC